MKNRTTDEASEDTARTKRRLPEIEIKIENVDRYSVGVVTRIATDAEGGWSRVTHLVRGDSLRIVWPDGFDWEPPTQVVELLYPEPEAVTA